MFYIFLSDMHKTLTIVDTLALVFGSSLILIATIPSFT